MLTPLGMAPNDLRTIITTLPPHDLPGTSNNIIHSSIILVRDAFLPIEGSSLGLLILVQFNKEE